MMKAEMMFYRLGYEKMKSDNGNIYYIKFDDKSKVDVRIGFYPKRKEIAFEGIRRNWWVVNESLQSAIIQQRKELGW